MEYQASPTGQTGLAFAVAWRQARTWPRHLRFYVLRVLYVLVLAAGGAIAIVANHDKASDFGLAMFKALAAMSTMGVLVMGSMMGAGLVKQHLRDSTMGLLMITDISVRAWLFGELIGLFWSAQAVMLSVIPLMMLVVRFGGVGATQILALLLVLEVLVTVSALGGIAWGLGRGTLINLKGNTLGLVLLVWLVTTSASTLPVFIHVLVISQVIGGVTIGLVVAGVGAVVGLILAGRCVKTIRGYIESPDHDPTPPRPVPKRPRPSVERRKMKLKQRRAKQEAKRQKAEWGELGALMWKDNKGVSPKEITWMWIALYVLVGLFWVVCGGLSPFFGEIMGSSLAATDIDWMIYIAANGTASVGIILGISMPMLLLWRCLQLVGKELECGTFDLLRLTVSDDLGLICNKVQAAGRLVVPGLAMPVVCFAGGMIHVGDKVIFTVGQGLTLIAAYPLFVAGSVCVGLYIGLSRGGVFMKAPAFAIAFVLLVATGTGLGVKSYVLVLAVHLVYAGVAAWLLRRKLAQL